MLIIIMLVCGCNLRAYNLSGAGVGMMFIIVIIIIIITGIIYWIFTWEVFYICYLFKIPQTEVQKDL